MFVKPLYRQQLQHAMDILFKLFLFVPQDKLALCYTGLLPGSKRLEGRGGPQVSQREMLEPLVTAPGHLSECVNRGEKRDGAAEDQAVMAEILVL